MCCEELLKRNSKQEWVERKPTKGGSSAEGGDPESKMGPGRRRRAMNDLRQLTYSVSHVRGASSLLLCCDHRGLCLQVRTEYWGFESKREVCLLVSQEDSEMTVRTPPGR